MPSHACLLRPSQIFNLNSYYSYVYESVLYFTNNKKFSDFSISIWYSESAKSALNNGDAEKNHTKRGHGERKKGDAMTSDLQLSLK